MKGYLLVATKDPDIIYGVDNYVVSLFLTRKKAMKVRDFLVTPHKIIKVEVNLEPKK